MTAPRLGTRASVVAVRRAAERVLQVEKNVIEMGECPERDWFMSKPGHKESFALARLALDILSYDDHPGVANSITLCANQVGNE